MGAQILAIDSATARADPATPVLPLDALYARYGQAAFILAYRIVRNPELAEDIVQDAFLIAWRNPDAYQRAQGHLKAWLLTVVRNRAIDIVRTQRGRVVHGVLETTCLGNARQSDPVEETLRRVEAAAVRAAVAALPALQQEAVRLIYFAGLTYTEAAARVNAPPGTVKSRVRLALAQLRQLVAGQEERRLAMVGI